MAAQGRDIKLATSRVEGYRNFATKIWNAARFAEHYEAAAVAGFDPATAKETLNRWIATETTRTLKAVTEAIEAYRFNEAAAALYRFVWNLTCDWYLELCKPVLSGEDGPAKAETRATVAWVLDRIAEMRPPVHAVPDRGDVGQHARRGAAAGAQPLADAGVRGRGGGGRDQLGDRLHHRGALGALGDERAGRRDGGPLGFRRHVRHGASGCQTYDVLIRRLARVGQISLAGAPLPGAVQIVVGETTVSMPLAGIIDMDAERARLEKESRKGDAGHRQDRGEARQRAVHGEGQGGSDRGAAQRLADATALRAKLDAALARLCRLARTFLCTRLCKTPP